MNDEDLIPQEEEAPAAWYISWADMVTILLTFFILIFTFSTISKNKFVEATSSIQRAFGMPIQDRQFPSARTSKPIALPKRSTRWSRKRRSPEFSCRTSGTAW